MVRVRKFHKGIVVPPILPKKTNKKILNFFPSIQKVVELKNYIFSGYLK
jgi:hypothetical protein